MITIDLSGNWRLYTNTIPREDLLAGIDSKLIKDYIPTPEAIKINRQRIQERMPKKYNISKMRRSNY